MRSQRGSPRKPPQHRVFQPGKRHMELIASVSRSSGLEKDGDALRDHKIQQEYRAFIQGKVDEYWIRYPLSLDDTRGETAASARNRKESQENLLILFRKLREGLLSTNRRDEFALEVYETSLYLSVLFKSPVQTTSALSHLFPDLYISIASYTVASPSASNTPNVAPASTSAPPTPTPPGSRYPSLPVVTPARPLPGSALAATVILLLHHLITTYPSQTAFYTQLRQLHPSLQAVLGTPLSALNQEPQPASLSAEAVASESFASPLSSMSVSSPMAKSTPKPKPTSSPLPEPAPHLAPHFHSAETNSRAPRSSPAATEAETQTAILTRAPSSGSVPAPAPGREPRAAPSPPSDAPPCSNPVSRPSPTPTSSESVSRSPETDTASVSARGWLGELARCLGTRNYARLEALTRREVFEAFVRPQGQGGPLHLNWMAKNVHTHAEPIVPIEDGAKGRTIRTRRSIQGGGNGREHDLAREAIGVLVEALLEKARGTAWRVLRTAYREVSLGATPATSSTSTTTNAPAPALRHDAGTTGDWLARSLVLRTLRPPRTLGSDSDGSGLDGSGVRYARLEAWLEERCGKGEARRKEGEGMEGRWIFVKA